MSAPKDGNGDRVSALDALVNDAKRDLAPPPMTDASWSAMEERIVAQMAQERSALVAEVHAPSSRVRALRIGAAVLAAAAAIALVVKNDPTAALLENGGVASQTELTAGSLRSTEGTGDVRVGGQTASVGHELRAGDLVEADGARALLERPRKVTWLLEHGNTEGTTLGRARVKSAGESLVLGLEDGAIEAQVTPVPSGEAFAVDVATGTSLVRVAVHGTHLRVSRSGSRVVVDLTEGVVSIGVPPRSGSTYGTFVTAPSHVEFDAADLDHTLRIDHAPGAVRAPVALVFHDAVTSAVAAHAADLPQAPPFNAHPPTDVPAPTEPRPVAAVARPAADPSRVAAKVDPAKPVLPARQAIAAAVRDCAAARSGPHDVRVTVSSTLKLIIRANGEVESAQFDPPLLPAIQTCASATIYNGKIEDAAGGTVTIPIDFSY